MSSSDSDDVSGSSSEIDKWESVGKSSSFPSSVHGAPRPEPLGGPEGGAWAWAEEGAICLYAGYKSEVLVWACVQRTTYIAWRPAKQAELTLGGTP